MGQWFADETEFANRGKLTWQTGKLNDRLGLHARFRERSVERVALWPGTLSHCRKPMPSPYIIDHTNRATVGHVLGHVALLKSEN